MIARYSQAVVSDRLQALTRGLDAHPTLPGKLLIYSAPMPAVGGADAGAASLLATLTFAKPSLSNVTGNTLTITPPTQAMIALSGDATWARAVNGGNQFVADFDVGIAGSGAAVQIAGASITLYAGGLLSVSVAQHTEA